MIELLVFFSMVIFAGYLVMSRYFARSAGVSIIKPLPKPQIAASSNVSEISPKLAATSVPAAANRSLSPLTAEGSQMRMRSLSMKRSNQPSPLSNLEKLQSLSQSRLPRMIPPEKERPKVELTQAELAGIEEIKKRLEKDGIRRCTIPGHHASDDAFIGRFVRAVFLNFFFFLFHFLFVEKGSWEAS